MDADVDKCAEVGDVGDLPVEEHTDAEVVDGADVGVEVPRFGSETGVATRLFELGKYVGEGGYAYFGGDVAVEVDAASEVGVGDEVGDVGAKVASHALHDVVAFGVDGGTVERII